MKQMETHEVTVGDKRFFIRPLPAFTAARLSTELTALAAPLLAGLTPLLALSGGEKGALDVDITDAAPAIAGAFSTLSGDKLEALLKHLLVDGGNVSVEMEDGKPKRLDVATVNEVFCEDVQDMFILAFYVIRLNYNGFFKKLSSQFGALADRLIQMAKLRPENTETST